MEEVTINPDAVEFESNDEDDISASYERDKIADVAVSASDWTTDTIISQLERTNIFLKPQFQRRDAWTIERKSLFIESLVLGFPIPQIVLAEKKGERGKYLVLDGKQRLLTLLQFVGSAEGHNNAFRLKNLQVAEELEGRSYLELSTDPTFNNQFTSFTNQTIRAVVLRNWPDITFLHLVFLRLNTGSVKLSPQELRQAMFPGDFSDFLDEYAVGSAPLKILLRLQEPDFRMRDVELLLRYVSFKNFIPEYKGDMKQFLDNTCCCLNRDWNEQRANVSAQLVEFDNAIAASIEIFGIDNVGRRPAEAGGRRPFNKAIFDILAFYFSVPEIRSKSIERKSDIIRVFDELWRDDKDFIRSVEVTTKSLQSTFKRLSAWGLKLSSVIETPVEVPRLENNRITF